MRKKEKTKGDDKCAGSAIASARLCHSFVNELFLFFRYKKHLHEFAKLFRDNDRDRKND